ncbi:MAG: ABC transporter permease, partial [Deltaproteobacteria bacterium]
MRIRSVATLAFTALLRNKMRSLLTTLGIVIGVAAVVMMQAMGKGATAYVGEAISGLGSNVLLVVPGSTHTMGPVSLGAPLFTVADIEAIRRDARDVGRIAGGNSRPLRLVAGSNNRITNVSGMMPDYLAIRGWGVSSGRLITAEDEHQGALVCVIGQSVRDALYAGQDVLGKELRVHDLACRVIGVMESKGAAAFGADQDDVVFMPHTTFARRVVGNERVGMIMASAVSADRIDAAKDEITSIMRRRRHILPGEPDDFAVRDPREIQALLESVTGMLTTLLAGVAAISLVVGGIGIMNIMLVSVTERTREIGIRLAIGARSSDILSQFLVEAVVLSALGGLVGLLFGSLGAYGAARASHP